jgi:membrane-bound metal-dependent hydrolase YbcI (DUF457 family)
MFAISHAATALVIKRRFPEAPMGWVLVAVQLPEILWVLLNLAGVERATAHMPYSHSATAMLALAFAAWLLLDRVMRRRAVAAAAAAGIASHLLLDLVTHQHDIVLVPFLGSVYLGLGLSAMPPLAIALASAYGVLCWLVFGGGKALLAAIVFLNLASLSFLQSPLAEEPQLRVAAAGLLVVLAVALVGYCSRERAAALEHPDRRLSRAFA